MSWQHNREVKITYEKYYDEIDVIYHIVATHPIKIIQQQRNIYCT